MVSENPTTEIDLQIRVASNYFLTEAMALDEEGRKPANAAYTRDSIVKILTDELMITEENVDPVLEALDTLHVLIKDADGAYRHGSKTLRTLDVI